VPAATLPVEAGGLALSRRREPPLYPPPRRRDEADEPELAELSVDAAEVVAHQGQQPDLVAGRRAGPASPLIEPVQVRRGRAQNGFAELTTPGWTAPGCVSTSPCRSRARPGWRTARQFMANTIGASPGVPSKGSPYFVPALVREPRIGGFGFYDGGRGPRRALEEDRGNLLVGAGETHHHRRPPRRSSR
jgi:hypothetical protein